jgi:hypothetical protein
MIAGSAADETGENFCRTFVMFSAAGIYITVLNVCYTLGWVVDTVLYNGRPRTRLYKSGYYTMKQRERLIEEPQSICNQLG